MRKHLVVFIALALLISLAACASTTDQSSAAPSPDASGGGDGQVTLTYWNLTAADMPFETELIEAFESEHPDIRIKMEQVPVENFHDKVVLAAQTGTLPDVIQNIPEWTSDFYEAGAILDITADIQDVLDTYIEGGMELTKWNDSYYGLPFRFGTSGIFVNQQMLEEKNITIPEDWTWDQFYEIAGELTDSEQGVYGFGLPGAASGDLGFSWNYLTFAFENGGKFIEDNRAAFASEESAGALDFLIKMKEDGIISQATTSFTAKDIVDAFGSGKIAMFGNGPWYIATVKSSYPDMEFTTVPLPTQNLDGAVESVSGGTYVSICEGTENYEQALTFIKWLTGEENMRQWAGQGEFLPPVKALLEEEAFSTGLIGAWAKQAQKPSISTGSTPENTTLMEILQTECGYALNGTKSSLDALRDAAAQWDEILANY